MTVFQGAHRVHMCSSIESHEAEQCGEDPEFFLWMIGRGQLSHQRRALLVIKRDERRHGAIEEALTVTGGRLAAIEDTTVETGSRVCGLEDSLTAASAMLGNLDAKLSEQGKGLSMTDGKLGTMHGKLGLLDTKLGALDIRLGAVDGKMGTLTGRLDGVDGRLEGMGARLDGLGDRFGSMDARVELVDKRLEPLAEELRAQPGRAEVEDTITKIIDPVHGDVTARLASLEEMVLTLAEALLRPGVRPAAGPGPREGNRI